jgi:hypothetical protein
MKNKTKSKLPNKLTYMFISVHPDEHNKDNFAWTTQLFYDIKNKCKCSYQVSISKISSGFMNFNTSEEAIENAKHILKSLNIKQSKKLSPF